MPDPEDPGNATVRASDAERERAVEQARDRWCSTGEEFEETTAALGRGVTTHRGDRP